MVAPGGAIQSLAPAVQTSGTCPTTSESRSAFACTAGRHYFQNQSGGGSDPLQKVMWWLIMEAMKMETEIRAARSGIVMSISVKEGDAIQVGTTLLTLG